LTKSRQGFHNDDVANRGAKEALSDRFAEVAKDLAGGRRVDIIDRDHGMTHETTNRDAPSERG